MQAITQFPQGQSPALINLSFKDSSAWLSALTRCATPDGAVTYLRGVTNRAAMLNLYREYFPEEFANSTASVQAFTSFPYGPSSADCPLSARELEFVELVDKKLFPVDTDVYIEWVSDEGPVELLPIHRLQYYCWHCGDYDPEDLAIVYKLALALMHGEHKLIARHAGNSTTHLLEHNSDGVSRFRLFEKRCKQMSGPIADVPLACRLINYNTGNNWLDWYCEQESEFYWATGDLKFLAVEYKEASVMLARVGAVNAWLTESPTERINQVIQIWNGTKNRRKKNESEPRAIPLIEIL